MLFAMTTDFCG